MPRGPAGPAAQHSSGWDLAGPGAGEGRVGMHRPASVQVRVRVAAFHLKKKKNNTTLQLPFRSPWSPLPRRPLLDWTLVLLIRVFIPARPLLGPCLISGLETRTATCLSVRAALQWLSGRAGRLRQLCRSKVVEYRQIL